MVVSASVTTTATIVSIAGRIYLTAIDCQAVAVGIAGIASGNLTTAARTVLTGMIQTARHTAITAVGQGIQSRLTTIIRIGVAISPQTDTGR